ncbi:MAG: helix-turn-helix domain-containing protein, partial [Christensenellales bacterium]
IKVPFNKIYSRYFTKYDNLAQNDIYQDITGFPLRNADGTVGCIVVMFMTTGIYHSRLDAMKAAEYMKRRWYDPFNIDEIARAAGLSPHYLTRLFKKYTGMTPYSYYQDIKVEKIKEALSDTSQSISEAFLSCGVDYNGRFAEIFRKKTGMTPSEYRKSLKAEERTQVKSQNAADHAPLHAAAPLSSHTWSVPESEELLFEVAAILPLPVQIFKPSGDLVYINEAVLSMWNILDASQVMGRYNLLNDTFLNDQLGFKDCITKALQGETVLIYDAKISLEQLWERYKTRSDVYDIESLYMDILNFPIYNIHGDMIYMVSVFFTRRVYKGRPDIVKAKEYIENSYLEDFDMGKFSKAMGISPSHLIRLFKKHTGTTPYSYYQRIKVNQLKKALQDQTISIAEAFAACGLAYSGSFARVFKEQAGMTPSQYRKSFI